MKPYVVMNPIFFLFSLCSAWMVGMGLRFIIDGYINRRMYNVNTFDVFFDWSILIILGISLFIYSIYNALKQNEEASSS